MVVCKYFQINSKISNRPRIWPLKEFIFIKVFISYKNSGEEDSHEQVEGILSVLKEANIIKGKDGTTFKLTDSELLVNGVKQSTELHKQLQKKYIYKPGDFYIFSSAGSTTDITVHRD